MFLRMTMFVLLLLTLNGCIKIVKIGEENTLTGEIIFDAVENVISVWDSKVMPELENKALDLAFLLKEAGEDLQSVAKKYGKYSMGDSGEINYTVKSKATIKEINNQLKAGYVVLSIPEYYGNFIIKLQVGPVFKGSSIRDSVNLIKYDDYKNQIEWASISQTIHQLIQEEIINNFDIVSLLGKDIEFIGCFTVQNNNEILITPVFLKGL